MAIAKKQRDRKSMDAEIKNALSGGIGEFELFFTEHWKALSSAGLAIVLLIGVFYGTRSWMESRERHALDQLASAKTVETLNKALADYSSSPGAPYARVRLARLYLEAHKIQEALAEYQKLETSGLPAQVLARIRVEAGYLLENAGDAKAAADMMTKVASDAAAPTGTRAEAALAAGRIYLMQKQPKEAKASLENCIRLEKASGGNFQQWTVFATFLLNDLP